MLRDLGVACLTQCSAQVPCTTAIRFARAVEEEIPQASSSSLHSLAMCSEAHSERDVHSVALRHNLTIPIPLSTVDLDDQPVNVLRMTDWAKWIMSMNLWFSLCGLKQPDASKSDKIWTAFWRHFACRSPGHPVFQRAATDPEFSLARCACLLIHGDEGRSRKKTAIMLLNVHSILGLGTAPSCKANKKRTGELIQMKLNYQGSSLVSRYFLACLPKSVYEDPETDNFERLVEHIVADLNKLYFEGVVGLDGQKYFFVVCFCMGDWPFLQKIGKFSRGFANVAKKETSKTDPKGICHACEADMGGVIWEDFHANEPEWRRTVNRSSPFPTQRPAVLQLPHDPENEVDLFAQDLFHAWHLGAAKVHLASMIAEVSYLFEGRGVDARFEQLTLHFKQWTKATQTHAYIRKITKETIHWGSTHDYPVGGWSKGTTSLALTKWMLALCNELKDEIPEDSILRKAWRGLKCMDSFLTLLYKENVWIEPARARTITAHGFAYLKWQALAAEQAHQENRPLFIYMPNLHRIHHILYSMYDSAKQGHHALSALAMSCQQDEDFVGRASRLSRRVSVRTTIQRTLERCLKAGYAQYVQAGLILPNS